MNSKKIILTIAAVLATGILFASQTLAAPVVTGGQVNLSGATLFKNFFNAPASTNDFNDMNGDGIKGFDYYNIDTPQQLAENWPYDTYWLIQYRATGSGSGLADLLNFYDKAPSTDRPWVDSASNFSPPTDNSYANRGQFGNIAGVMGIGNPANPGGYPVDPCSIDIGIMDVPTTWFVQQSGTPNWKAKPLGAGYGTMNLTSANQTSQGNKVKTLTNHRGKTFNLNLSSPDANTIYDSQIAWVAIAYCANPGTGITSANITQQQLQYLYTTGRMPSGENLVAATRDSGSGTRNAAMNSIGVDPSWGRGENTGKKSQDPNITMLGSTQQPCNLDSTGVMKAEMANRRLAVGYMGITDAAPAATISQFDILNLKKIGATSFVRPYLSAILNNSDPSTGWQIGGNETMVTVGDPNTVNSHPHMRNQYAAQYIMNVRLSVAEFAKTAGSDPNWYMPGDYMAGAYFLAQALDAVSSSSDPTQFVTNPVQNVALKNWILGNNTLSVPSTLAGAGKIPTRVALTAPAHYSDGRQSTYLSSDGSTVLTGGQPLNNRNRVIGDFSFDGKRNINDIDRMMMAFNSPRTFGNTEPNRLGEDGWACTEILGDFNGDGSFTDADIRYFADGLAIDPATGKLNRATGFTKVDQAWTAAYAAADVNHPTAGNFFNITLAPSLGRAYLANSGWSRADIAGKAGVAITPGSSPVGSDGKIDAQDIDYLNYILRGGIKAAATGQTLAANPAVRTLSWNFADANNAPYIDLSCDMNGDLKVDSTDIDYAVQTVLGTQYGDVNLDGKVDFKDFAILAQNFGTAGGWAKGDTNGDGFVDLSDMVLMQQNWLFGH